MSANPEMVTLVREAKGWTQEELKDAANKVLGYPNNVTQGYLSKVENGLLEMSGERLAQIAAALDCPPALLENRDPRRGLEVSCVFHRRRKSTITVSLAKKIEATGHLTRITVDRLFGGIDVATDVALERMDIDEYSSPEEIARLLRARWRVPSGPIGNLTALLESVGIVIVVRPTGSSGQDAFSTWPPDRLPLMVVTAGLSPDRYRFTLAHEVGHIVMHVMPNAEQEAQANRFAGEFLAPADEITPQLTGLTTRDFNKLMGLKAEWRVSIGMLIQRAKDLDCISDRQFKEFRIKLARMGWDRAEPVDLPAEHPTLVQKVISYQRDHNGYSTVELADLALMTRAAFERHYLPDASGRAHLRAM